MPEPWQNIIRSGTWLYDGIIPTGVHIVCQNYDYWYSLGQADNNLETDEQPTLNSDGVVYYVLFGAVPAERPCGVRGSGFMSAEDAALWAATQVPSPIQWHQ
jgi:hypothetical protein